MSHSKGTEPQGTGWCVPQVRWTASYKVTGSWQECSRYHLNILDGSRQKRPELEGSPHHRMRGVYMTPWAATLASPYTDTLSTPLPLPSAELRKRCFCSPASLVTIWSSSSRARKSGNWTTPSGWKPQSVLSCLKQTKQFKNKQKPYFSSHKVKHLFLLVIPAMPWSAYPFPEYSSGTHTSVSRPLFVSKVLWLWLPKPLL